MIEISNNRRSKVKLKKVKDNKKGAKDAISLHFFSYEMFPTGETLKNVRKGSFVKIPIKCNINDHEIELTTLIITRVK